MSKNFAYKYEINSIKIYNKIKLLTIKFQLEKKHIAKIEMGNLSSRTSPKGLYSAQACYYYLTVSVF